MTHNPITPPQHLVDRFADLVVDRALLSSEVNSTVTPTQLEKGA